MTITRTASAVTIVLALCSGAPTTAAAGQDPLARAKDLYASAAYDEALALLNQFANASPGETVEVDQYRAFCLLALGRSEDARKVIQQLVVANPSFQPSESQASPRLQAAFRDVRRRVLPSIVRQSYADGKAAFERKEFDVALRRFDSTIALLNDPDLAGSDDLRDLKLLSSGFQELIKTASTVPAPPPPPPPAPAVAAATPTRETPVPPSIYGLDDPNILPPVPIAQPMPPWNPSINERRTYQGRLILVIDETGRVTSVELEGVLPSPYESQLRRAASQWRYSPATKNDVPVKFRKIVAIRLSPST
jgi:hypothetical protein